VLTDGAGESLVRRARAAIARAVGIGGAEDAAPAPGVPSPPEPRGLFVTVRRYPSGDLRGCIGFPTPRYPVEVGVSRAAVFAATEDPRFPPVRPGELDRLTVEVSVLTRPTPVPPEERPQAVRPGTDGLIVETDRTSGLLLPQVAAEMGWGATDLLEGTCEKAGLPRDAWRDPRVRVLRFQAEVFAEVAPGGRVVREGTPPPTDPAVA
jgi:uncharacterized protein